MAGATGVQGAQGKQGTRTTGNRGHQGAIGAQGSMGATGIQGVQGKQGTIGKTGNRGHQGAIGAQGVAGATGVQGAQGKQGTRTTGNRGHQGAIGAQGSMGATGVQGWPGAQGGTGANGIWGWMGVQGKMGQQGSAGIAGSGSGSATQIYLYRATDTSTLRLIGVTSTAVGLKRVNAISAGPYMLGTELYAGSDISLKSGITEISKEFIDKLFTYDNVTYEFNWKTSGKPSNGFIAQYLEELIPEAIDLSNDNILYVNYNSALSKILGALFKKVKEQDEFINKLRQHFNLDF